MSAPQQQQRATRLMARLVAKPQLRPKPKRPRRPSRTNAATVVLQWQNKRCTVCNRQNPWQNVGGASTVERAAAALTLVSCGVERVESCVVRVERRSVRHLSPCGASRWGHPRHRSVYRGDNLSPWCETQTWPRSTETGETGTSTGREPCRDRVADVDRRVREGSNTPESSVTKCMVTSLGR
jgi:hypothetical protein